MTDRQTIRITPQLRTIAKHFKNHGSITNVEAHAVYGIRSVSSRVAELRNLGLTINKDQRKDATGQRYTRYVMPQGQRDCNCNLCRSLFGSAN